MNTHEVVSKLIESGYTQDSLAAKLSAIGVKTTQPTISRALRNPNYETRLKRFQALMQVYSEIQQSAA